MKCTMKFISLYASCSWAMKCFRTSDFHDSLMALSEHLKIMHPAWVFDNLIHYIWWWYLHQGFWGTCSHSTQPTLNFAVLMYVHTYIELCKLCITAQLCSECQATYCSTAATTLQSNMRWSVNVSEIRSYAHVKHWMLIVNCGLNSHILKYRQNTLNTEAQNKITVVYNHWIGLSLVDWIHILAYIWETDCNYEGRSGIACWIYLWTVHRYVTQLNWTGNIC